MMRIRLLVVLVLPPLLLAGALLLRPGEQVYRLGPLLRLDALAYLQLLGLGLGLGLARRQAQPGSALLLAAGLLLAYTSTLLPLVVLGLLIATLGGLIERRARPAARLLGLAAPLLLALGYGWLGSRAGAWSFEAEQLPAALDSAAVGLTILAAALGAGLPPLVPPAERLSLGDLLLRPAWLYPLARLYELGPWNTGWVLATALLGGAAACWAGWSAPFQAGEQARLRSVHTALLASALATLGLTTEAGLAGALLGMLASTLVAGALTHPCRHWLLWLAAVPMPLTLPFVALWLQISASIAGGLVILGAALWLSAIGWIVALLRAMGAGPPEPASFGLRLLAWLSLCAGVFSPLLLQLLIHPALLQLGAGVRAYGSPTPWPWLGLEVRGAGGGPVATWLSLAVALVIIVLIAIAYLGLRLVGSPAGPHGHEPADEPAERVLLWQQLRAQLPWFPRGERHEPE